MKERNKYIRIAKNVQRRNNIYYLYAIDNKSMCKKRVVKRYMYNTQLTEHENNIIAIQKQKDFEKDLNYTIKLKKVLQEYEKVILITKKPNTIKQYKSYINKYLIDSNILNYDIKKISSMMLLEYLNSIKKINARYNVMCILKQIFIYAYVNNYVDTNVMIYINSNNINTFDISNTKQEKIYNIHDILSYFNQDKTIDFIIIILVLTGLRIGELLALETKDIDTNTRTININKNLSYIDKSFIIDTPKSKSSKRKVIYSHVLDNIINCLLDKASKKQSNLIVSDKAGNYIKYNTLTKSLKQRTKGSKFNKMHLHLCRKIYINACIDLNIVPLEIAKRVGHKDINTIISNYYDY